MAGFDHSDICVSVEVIEVRTYEFNRPVVGSMNILHSCSYWFSLRIAETSKTKPLAAR